MAIELIQINDVSGPIIMNAGFIIIADKPLNHKDAEEVLKEKVVLGVRPNLCEYVTWVCVNEDEFYSGHYYVDFRDAVRDFEIRS